MCIGFTKVLMTQQRLILYFFFIAVMAEMAKFNVFFVKMKWKRHLTLHYEIVPSNLDIIAHTKIKVLKLIMPSNMKFI